MSLNREDRMAQALLPAVRSTRPSRVMQQVLDVAHAIEPGGFVAPGALRTISRGDAVRVDFGSASNTASSSDTVTPAEYIGVTFTLPEGVWRLKARVAVTGSLSGSSNLNAYVYLNGEASTNYQIPIAANQLATVFAYYSLESVSGEVTLQGMYRPSAGTATIEAGEWLYRAERID